MVLENNQKYGQIFASNFVVSSATEQEIVYFLSEVGIHGDI